MPTDLERPEHSSANRAETPSSPTRGSSGKRATFLLGGVVVVICLAFGIWHAVAASKLADYEGRASRLFAQVTGARSGLIDANGTLCKSVPAVAIETYLTTYESQEPAIKAIIRDMSNGDGMGFWLKDQREQSSAKLQGLLATEAATVNDCKQALPAVNQLRNALQERLQRTSQARVDGQGVIGPASEAQTFRDARSRIISEAASLEPLVAGIDASSTSPMLTGRSEGIRLALLNGMRDVVQAEKNSCTSRVWSLDQAERLLGQYQDRLDVVTGQQQALFSALVIVGSTVQPGIERAYSGTGGLRQLFSEAEKPVFGRTTALDMARKIDPSIGATIDVLKGTCDSIELARKEVGECLKVTQPLVQKVNQYHMTRTRSDMIAIAATAKNALPYYDSKKGVFDPLIAKLAAAQQSIAAFRSAVSRIKLPAARNAMQRIADTGDGMIGLARLPVGQGKQAIINICTALQEVSSVESRYADTLKQLAGDQLDTSRSVSL